MDEAAAGEGDEIRLALAPACQRRRPVPGPTKLVDVLAREDHAAVDDSRHDRGHLALGDRDHRLVKEAEAFAGPARPHQQLPLRVDREREEVPVAEALGYCDDESVNGEAATVERNGH